MPAAIPILIAVTAATATYGAVQQNQQIQHAKGAAEAQETAINAQVKDSKAKDAQSMAAKGDQASATQAAALAALRANMTATGGLGGSILTSGQGTAPAPTVGKTLLGA